MADDDLVIYDGVCNFCNGAVAFIIKRDKAARFVFAPMQSEYAQKVIEHYEVDTVGVDTFMLVKNGHVFLWSDAALEITKDLSGAWCLFRIFKIFPQSFRDFFYKLFARNRIRIFGGTKQCQIPNKQILKRFRGFAI
ncbi:thiol-disulfide oxidoreductase DCC family protein [Paraglaciecola sp. 2405UD69-4]|uniref:thiol-disulfide oxidoreductase DCC family protein n=1 Tax=Paraglaciecola sp. 2405UD69-4 TaxID=3391836 RepID=UPI0039C91D92